MHIECSPILYRAITPFQALPLSLSFSPSHTHIHKFGAKIKFFHFQYLHKLHGGRVFALLIPAPVAPDPATTNSSSHPMPSWTKWNKLVKFSSNTAKFERAPIRRCIATLSVSGCIRDYTFPVFIYDLSRILPTFHRWHRVEPNIWAVSVWLLFGISAVVRDGPNSNNAVNWSWLEPQTILPQESSIIRRRTQTTESHAKKWTAKNVEFRCEIIQLARTAENPLKSIDHQINSSVER